MAPRLESNIWKMYLFKFFVSLAFFSAVLVPFFIDWIKIDYTQIFILQSWYLAWNFILEVPTGVVADRVGRKWSIAAGSLSWTVGMIAYGSINSYLPLFFAEFMCALGSSLLSGADTALAYDTLLNIRRKTDARIIFSRLEIASTLGLVAGSIGGSTFAGSGYIPYPQTLPLTFIFTAISTSLALFLALSIKEPQRKTPIDSPIVRTGWESIRHIFHHKKLRAFVFNDIAITATSFLIIWFYPALAANAGIGVKYLGWIVTGYSLFSIVLLLNIKRLESFFGIENILSYTGLIPGALFILLSWTRSATLILPGIFLIVGLASLRPPILADFMNRHIECKRRATVLSGVSMLLSIFKALLYPLIGLLADTSLQYALLFLGIVTIVFSMATKIEARDLD